MEAPSNGGLLYHEVQESKLCAVHCVNTVLQGPFFSELDLAALASDLDQRERQMMLQGSAVSGDFLSEDSHNVSMGGDFSIQVLEKALEIWGLQVIPLNSPIAEPSRYDPELENGFICHLEDHWFCIRKVNGEWYNFNSLYVAPEHLSKFYLSAYLDTLKDSGWSIFLVRGNFPKECPISSSDASNGFGQWLTPEDAVRITKSCNQRQEATQRTDLIMPSNSTNAIGIVDDIFEQEEQDLNAAIAASLMDSSAFRTEINTVEEKGNSTDSTKASTVTGSTNDSSNLMDPETFGTGVGEAEDKNSSDSASNVAETDMPKDNKEL